MGLVNELQESAEGDDVLVVLRKAKRLSSKRGLDDISEWIDHEQNGYPDEAALPAYRRIGMTFWYETNGYVPAGYGLLVNGRHRMPDPAPGLTAPIVLPIGSVMGWVAQMQDGGGLYMTIRGPVAQRMRGMFRHADSDVLNQLTFAGRLDEFAIRDIPEQVKNKVLDWGCRLEAAGVHGERHSFTSAERHIAGTMIYNVIERLDQSNTVTIDGAVAGGIQVASPRSTQRARVRR